MFSLNTSLYRVEENLPIPVPGQGYHVQVELYDTTAKIEEISAYTFHPNQTNWWDWIMNWFIELFYGRTAVLVRVDGEPSALYVRVDDLSRVLNISSRAIRREVKGEDATDLLIEHQMRQTAYKIKKFVEDEGVFWTPTEQKGIQALMQEVGYQNVFKAVDSDAFDARWMALTLVQVGRQLAQCTQEDLISQKSYDYDISLPEISIWKIEDFKKTKINLKDLKLTEEDLLKKTSEKIGTLAQQEGMQWTPTDQENMESLISEVGYQNILEVLDHPQFYPGWIACTLIEAARKRVGVPNIDSQHQISYEFEIDLPTFLIWKIENYKKTQINLEDLTVTIEDLPKPLIHLPTLFPGKVPPTIPGAGIGKSSSLLDRLTKVFQPVPPEKEQQEFETIAAVFGVDPKNMKHLASLAARVGYSNLILTLGRLERKDKFTMLNTFIDIGQQLSMPAFLDAIFANFRLQYVGKRKEGKKVLTYAFAINKKEIFIAQAKLGEGGFKCVADAIKLNDIDDSFVRIKVKEEDKRKISDLKQTRRNVLEIRKEAKLIEKLYEHKDKMGGDCIILPFACEIVSDKEKKKVIFFQKKYDGGDGDKLKKASIFQIVHVLRDVAKGLTFIHLLNLVHMDMKPGNFLIQGNIQSRIPAKGKVSDFGMSAETGSRFPGGSLLYLPPEALMMRKGKIKFNPDCIVNDKIDSFSFGVTILEILDPSLNYVLGVMNQDQINSKIKHMSQRLSYSSKRELKAKKDLLEVAQQLLKHDASRRISCAETVRRLETIAQDVS
jgi:hypothetical protein